MCLLGALAPLKPSCAPGLQHRLEPRCLWRGFWCQRFRWQRRTSACPSDRNFARDGEPDFAPCILCGHHRLTLCVRFRQDSFRGKYIVIPPQYNCCPLTAGFLLWGKSAFRSQSGLRLTPHFFPRRLCVRLNSRCSSLCR